jgi:serine/threonine protein kinase
VFENKEKMVLVMEIAAGGELYDYLSERKSLEETEARRIFRQIATAVYYCHKVSEESNLATHLQKERSSSHSFSLPSVIIEAKALPPPPTP